MGVRLLSVPVLASGSDDTGAIIIVVLLVAFLLGLGWILIKKGGEYAIEEDTAKPVVTPVVKPVGKPPVMPDEFLNRHDDTSFVVDEVIDTETIDHEYARRNNMWVCAYCETLNRCLPGDNLVKEAMASVEAPVVSHSRLSGNLLKKRAMEEVSKAGKKGAPECIACGKPRNRLV